MCGKIDQHPFNSISGDKRLILFFCVFNQLLKTVHYLHAAD